MGLEEIANEEKSQIRERIILEKEMLKGDSRGHYKKTPIPEEEREEIIGLVEKLYQRCLVFEKDTRYIARNIKKLKHPVKIPREAELFVAVECLSIYPGKEIHISPLTSDDAISSINLDNSIPGLKVMMICPSSAHLDYQKGQQDYLISIDYNTDRK